MSREEAQNLKRCVWNGMSSLALYIYKYSVIEYVCVLGFSHPVSLSHKAPGWWYKRMWKWI